MKKVFAGTVGLAVVSMVLGLTLSGCMSANPAGNAQTYQEDIPSRFVVIERGNYWYVVADQETKVMYTVSGELYNYGNFTMLVDSDGTPLLYEGEL